MQAHPNPKVLDFGTSGSTIWFALRTPNLITAEEQQYWIDYLNDIFLAPGSPYNPVEFILWPRPYHTIIATYPDEEFDIVFVNGTNGIECVEDSMRILKPGGLLILEEAQREDYAPVYDLLKDWQFDRTVQDAPDLLKHRYFGMESNCWTKPVARKSDA